MTSVTQSPSPSTSRSPSRSTSTIRALLQPRAVVGGLQRPRPATRRGHRRPAAGADEVLRDHHVQHGRVLHGPRRGIARPARRGHRRAGPDGVSAGEAVDRIKERVGDLTVRQIRCLEQSLIPGLAEHGIVIASIDDVSEHDRRELAARFTRQIFPVLTPLAVGLGRPFPYISNLSLARRARPRSGLRPRDLRPREGAQGDAAALRSGGEGLTFVPMEQVIASTWTSSSRDGDPRLRRLPRHPRRRLQRLRRGRRPAAAVEDELRRRRFGEIIRVEVGSSMNPRLRDQLVEGLGVQAHETFHVDGLLDLADLWQIVNLPGFKDLRDPPWTPVTQRGCRARTAASTCSRPCAPATCSSTIPTTRSRPRSSASCSRRWRTPTCSRSSRRCTGPRTTRRSSRRSSAPRSAASRRCASSSSGALRRAREHPVAKALEEAGVHVTYGIPSLKTHARRSSSCAARATVCATTCTSAPQLPPEDRAPLHRLRPVHDRRGDRVRRRRPLQLPHRLRAAARLPQGSRRAEPPARGIIDEIEKTIAYHVENGGGRIAMR